MSFTMGEEGLRVWSRVPIARSGFNFIDIKCGPLHKVQSKLFAKKCFPAPPRSINSVQTDHAGLVSVCGVKST